VYDTNNGMNSNVPIRYTAQLDGVYFFRSTKERKVSRREGEPAMVIVMLGGIYSALWKTQRITAKGGDVVCWHQGDLRIEENDPAQPTRCLVLNIRWKDHPESLPRVVRDAAGLMRMLALRIFAMTKDPLPSPVESWNVYLHALLAEYVRMSLHRAKSLLDRVNQCLEEHLAEPFTLIDMARWIGLERHYFGQRFKRETGMSPMRYVRAQRVQHALGYLATSPSWTLRKIAPRIGVPDEIQLRRLIRQYTGLGIRDLKGRIPPEEILPFAQSLTRWT